MQRTRHPMKPTHLASQKTAIVITSHQAKATQTSSRSKSPIHVYLNGTHRRALPMDFRSQHTTSGQTIIGLKIMQCTHSTVERFLRTSPLPIPNPQVARMPHRPETHHDLFRLGTRLVSRQDLEPLLDVTRHRSMTRNRKGKEAPKTLGCRAPNQSMPNRFQLTTEHTTPRSRMNTSLRQILLRGQNIHQGSPD
ncbi:hypothetical protein GBA52_010562 [Prunus armeniaca]|nr:hypothetical protein GBA52_010562 [Prunus armeniaca]